VGILKMFHEHSSPADSPSYWASVWGTLDREAYAGDARRHCASSPLWKLTVQTARSDRLFVDGGCGHGYWVKCLHDLGYRAAGVDFSEDTVRQIHKIDPRLDVRVGDIRAMPFDAGSVHVYYSGGVVEHFEDGPAHALREARRILAPDGWFFCSVPDLSPLRRALYRGATDEREVRSGNLTVRRAGATRAEAPRGEERFYCYLFAESQFVRLLQDAGFDVVDSFGTNIAWGLMEFGPVRDAYRAGGRVLEALRKSKEREPAVGADGVREASGPTKPPSSRGQSALGRLGVLAKRVMVQEDRSVPVLGRGVRLAGELAANMRVYVARPSLARPG